MQPQPKPRSDSMRQSFNPRDAVGWLFVAWLAVVCGSYAYYMLRSFF